MKIMKCRQCSKDISLEDRDYDMVANRDKLLQCHKGCLGYDDKINGKVMFTSLSNFLMGDNRLYDHKDRNNHNMLRGNLRVATRSQNNANRIIKPGRTGFRYVRFDTRSRYNHYYATVSKDGVQYYTSNYLTAERAAREGDKLALQLHGEFAVLNFPSP